jgi:2',3'-cyclic-nucleotide 2'-phosphodiesterase (5'-nucleotidase family)
MRGGLARRITVIDSLRRAYPDLIVLDGGDFGEAAIGFDVWKTAELFKVMLALGYDAIGLGERDIAPAFFKEIAKSEGRKILLSGNWRPAVELDLAPIKLIERESFKVGVVEIVSPFLQQGNQAAGAKDSRSFFQEQLAALKKQNAEVIVAIYHGPANEALALRKSFPEVDLWLLSHGLYTPLNQIPTDEGPLVVSPGNRGREVGLIVLQKEKNNSARSAAFSQIILDSRIPDSPKAAPWRQRFLNHSQPAATLDEY